MNRFAENLKARTKRFALDVIEHHRRLPVDDAARIVGAQLLRAGTSVGANYRAACRARSRRDFISKVGVTLEEADEAAFWIEVLVDGKLVRGNGWLRLLREADELSAILAQSRITATQRLRDQRP